MMHKPQVNTIICFTKQKKIRNVSLIILEILEIMQVQLKLLPVVYN